MKVLRPLLLTTATADLVGHLPDLVNHYQTLDDNPSVMDGQHPIRKWEYAMALRAFYAWKALPTNVPQRTSRMRIADIGGAGSNFFKVVAGITGAPVLCIDPSYPQEDTTPQQVVFPMTVEQAVYRLLDPVAMDQREAYRFDVVFCISVVEHLHLTDLPRFLDAVTALMKRGGLLVLTTDYHNDIDTPDNKHFHWMRERIYDRMSFGDLLDDLGRLGYNSLGGTDLRYNGPQVFDYTMAAAALVYQPEPLLP